LTSRFLGEGRARRCCLIRAPIGARFWDEDGSRGVDGGMVAHRVGSVAGARAQLEARDGGAGIGEVDRVGKGITTTKEGHTIYA
jgi:hypothetical protein